MGLEGAKRRFWLVMQKPNAVKTVQLAPSSAIPPSPFSETVALSSNTRHPDSTVPSNNWALESPVPAMTP